MRESLLIAEDNERVAESLKRFLARRLPVAVAHSYREAEELMLAPTTWLGAIFDVSLPDGCGLDLLDAFRRIEPVAPALVLTGHCDATLINRAQTRRAEYAVKPAETKNLRAFAERATEHRNAREREIEVIIAALGERHALSASERRILAALVRGAARKELAERFGVAESTIKMQVKTLLRKCDDAEGTADIVRDVWRRASAD